LLALHVRTAALPPTQAMVDTTPLYPTAMREASAPDFNAVDGSAPAEVYAQGSTRRGGSGGGRDRGRSSRRKDCCAGLLLGSLLTFAITFGVTYPVMRSHTTRAVANAGIQDKVFFRIQQLDDISLRNRDAGDALGDLSFLYQVHWLPEVCKNISASPPAVQPVLKLMCEHIGTYQHLAVVAYQVKVNTLWGPYLMCNFNGTGWYCDPPCPTSNSSTPTIPAYIPTTAVGRVTLDQHSLGYIKEYYSGFVANFTSRFGPGLWYSFTADSECGPGESVGAECTWRIEKVAAAASADCIFNNTNAVITAEAMPCYLTCPKGDENCYQECYLHAIVNMPDDQLLSSWMEALHQPFNPQYDPSQYRGYTKCPSLPLPPPSPAL